MGIPPPATSANLAKATVFLVSPPTVSVPTTQPPLNPINPKALQTLKPEPSILKPLYAQNPKSRKLST